MTGNAEGTDALLASLAGSWTLAGVESLAPTDAHTLREVALNFVVAPRGRGTRV